MSSHNLSFSHSIDDNSHPILTEDMYMKLLFVAYQVHVHVVVYLLVLPLSVVM